MSTFPQIETPYVEPKQDSVQSMDPRWNVLEAEEDRRLRETYTSPREYEHAKASLKAYHEQRRAEHAAEEKRVANDKLLADYRWIKANSDGNRSSGHWVDPDTINVVIRGAGANADQARDALNRGWITRAEYEAAVLAACRQRDPRYSLPPHWSPKGLPANVGVSPSGKR